MIRSYFKDLEKTNNTWRNLTHKHNIFKSENISTSNASKYCMLQLIFTIVGVRTNWCNSSVPASRLSNAWYEKIFNNNLFNFSKQSYFIFRSSSSMIIMACWECIDSSWLTEPMTACRHRHTKLYSFLQLGASIDATQDCTCTSASRRCSVHKLFHEIISSNRFTHIGFHTLDNAIHWRRGYWQAFANIG